jgi:hypothetical protein
MRLIISSLLACQIHNTLATPITSQSTNLIGRDTSVFERSFYSITAATNQFTQAITSLNPAAQDNRYQAQEIDRSGRNAVEAKRRATEDLRRAPTVQSNEAKKLADPLTAVQTASQSNLQVLISAAPLIKRLGGRESITRILQEMLAVAGDFNNVIVQKAPDSARGQVKTGADLTRSKIAEALRVYQSP